MKTAKFTNPPASGPRPRGAAVVVQHVGGVFRGPIVHATRDGTAFVVGCLIRHSLFDVISFAGKDQQRLVLRLPAETRNRPIVAAGVESAADTELGPGGPVAAKFVRRVASGGSTRPTQRLGLECGKSHC